MSEFIKGPWFYVAGFIRSTSDNRLWIASTVDIPYRNGGEKSTKANGHLLAAAPEMLATLKSMRATLLRLGGDPMPTLDEVIAKAEGK
jgi:hypothetical protein